MAGVKGAIFDLDSTLLDTDSLWEDIDREFLAERGLAVPPDYIDALNTMSFREAAEYTIRRFSLDDTPDDLLRIWREMSEHAYGCSAKLKDGAAELLEKMRTNGIKLAAATDLDPRLASLALDGNGISGYFDAVLTTKETGRDKSSPDIFLAAAASLSVHPSAAAVFEDMLVPIETAGKAGFVTVGVYDTSCPVPEERMRSASCLYIRSFREVHLCGHDLSL